MSQDLNVILNFICGWGSGVVEVFVMQPFEMVKVRLINQSHHEKHYNGIIDCIQKIYLREGITSFYKGIVFYMSFRNAITPADNGSSSCCPIFS